MTHIDCEPYPQLKIPVFKKSAILKKPFKAATDCHEIWYHGMITHFDPINPIRR